MDGRIDAPLDAPLIIEMRVIACGDRRRQRIKGRHIAMSWARDKHRCIAEVISKIHAAIHQPLVLPFRLMVWMSARSVYRNDLVGGFAVSGAKPVASDYVAHDDKNPVLGVAANLLGRVHSRSESTESTHSAQQLGAAARQIRSAPPKSEYPTVHGSRVRESRLCVIPRLLLSGPHSDISVGDRISVISARPEASWIRERA